MLPCQHSFAPTQPLRHAQSGWLRYTRLFRKVATMPRLPLRTILLFNCCYWSAIAALELGSLYLESSAFADNTAVQVYVLLLFMCAGQALLTSLLMLYANTRRCDARWLLCTTLTAGCCFVPLSNLLIRWYYQSFNFALPALLAQLDTQLLAFFVWASAYLIYQHNLAQQQQQANAAALQQQIQQAELAALQQQLNPHFTFNALNSLCALLESNRYDDAELMSEQLADFLRYSLAHPPLALVPLAQELAAVDTYLQLQRIRFGPRLRFRWQQDGDVSNIQVPVLLLQPLVENAVKYAVASRRDGACIEIRITRHANQLTLEVHDDGPGLPSGTLAGTMTLGIVAPGTVAPAASSQRSLNESPLNQHQLNQSSLSEPQLFPRDTNKATSSVAAGTGLGLQNIRQRLARHFGDAASLTILTPTQGFAVRLILPAPEVKA